VAFAHNGLGFNRARRFVAKRPGTCTNCTDGIQPGETCTYAWGGTCHIRCLKNLGTPATQSTYREIEQSKPIISDRQGTCPYCRLPYYPGSILLRSGNRYHHKHCAVSQAS
jgi:hypothetical protein